MSPRPACAGVGTFPQNGDLSSALGHSGRRQAQSNSRVDRNVTQKGSLTSDHCSQPWGGREGGWQVAGLVTAERTLCHPRPRQDPRCPYGPLTALTHILEWDFTEALRD